MRPTLQYIIERAWNEIANLPDGEKPKVWENQLTNELVSVYEQGGRTPQQFEEMLKADIETLLFAYSFALRKFPRYWNPEPMQNDRAYDRMAYSMRTILTNLLAEAFDMGLHLPQDELQRYEGIDLWVQDFKPFVAQLYGENTGDEACANEQIIPESGTDGQLQGNDQNKPLGVEGESPQAATILTLYDESNDIGVLERRIYGQALKKGYIKLDSTGKYTKGSITWVLIAYMCGRIYCKDRVSTDEFGDEKLFKGSNFPATKIKTIFNANIGNHRDQYKEPPKNHYKIDDLFKNPEASH